MCVVNYLGQQSAQGQQSTLRSCFMKRGAICPGPWKNTERVTTNWQSKKDGTKNHGNQSKTEYVVTVLTAEVETEMQRGADWTIWTETILCKTEAEAGLQHCSLWLYLVLNSCGSSNYTPVYTTYTHVISSTYPYLRLPMAHPATGRYKTFWMKVEMKGSPHLLLVLVSSLSNWKITLLASYTEHWQQTATKTKNNY